jgi:hypothetical protein
VFALAVLVWPLFTLPFWLIRYGMLGQGGLAKRVVAVAPFVLLGPVLLVVGVASTPPLLGVGTLYTTMLVIAVVMAVRKKLTGWTPEWPADFPGVIPDGSTTRVGRENARRNPQRTASTAAALMIGLALVTLVATLASGIIKPFTERAHDADHRDRRRAADEQGHRTRLAGWLADDDRPPRCEWRGGQQGLRQGPRPHGRLTNCGRDAYRPGAPSRDQGHLRSADRRIALRHGDRLEHDLRRALAAAAQPLRVHHDEGRRSRTTRSPGSPPSSM